MKKKPATAKPQAPVSLRPRIIPRHQIWCCTCRALAPEKDSERTPHGFAFCKAHRAKAK